jgi:hypothetical protein
MTGKTTKLDQCIDLKNTLDYNLIQSLEQYS